MCLFVVTNFRCTDIRDLLNGVVEIVKRHEPIEVCCDCSIFMQEGRELRELIPGTQVFCYKPKTKLEERAAAHALWAKENLSVKKEGSRLVK